ncbi:hypothetical protein JCM19296_1785 [Nonlabens ulvanivorans]|uniref:Uncharacterized protein n=1 Tax=Nonlabens ulvanivorans TaxID=906888 RepID=A0A081DB92_NONUL|nr:hypothetical protein JCM19296_1785 [Nonlabens ulvanivorans]
MSAMMITIILVTFFSMLTALFLSIRYWIHLILVVFLSLLSEDRQKRMHKYVWKYLSPPESKKLKDRYLIFEEDKAA